MQKYTHWRGRRSARNRVGDGFHSLIAERVRAGLQNARAKGKRLGRPRVIVDARKIATLRYSRPRPGRRFARKPDSANGTAQRALHSLPKNWSTFGQAAAD